MAHISDFKSTLCLFKNSVQYIEPNGVLYFYGPFNKANQFTSPGNEAFHMSLKQQNPQWGLRDVETIIHSAEESGWALIQHIDMPANNMSLFFQLNPWLLSHWVSYAALESVSDWQAAKNTIQH